MVTGGTGTGDKGTILGIGYLLIITLSLYHHYITGIYHNIDM